MKTGMKIRRQHRYELKVYIHNVYSKICINILRVLCERFIIVDCSDTN